LSGDIKLIQNNVTGCRFVFVLWFLLFVVVVVVVVAYLLLLFFHSSLQLRLELEG